MDNTQVIQEWITASLKAVKALQDWRWFILTRAKYAPTVPEEDFNAALRKLNDVIGDTWADRNPAGDGLDRLRQALTGHVASSNDVYFDQDTREWIAVALSGNLITGRTRAECEGYLDVADAAYLDRVVQERLREE